MSDTPSPNDTPPNFFPPPVVPSAAAAPAADAPVPEAGPVAVEIVYRIAAADADAGGDSRL